MAEKDLETEKLELSLFRRRKKGKKQPAEAGDTAPAESTKSPPPEPAAHTPATEPTTPAPTAAGPPPARATEAPTSGSITDTDTDTDTEVIPAAPPAAAPAPSPATPAPGRRRAGGFRFGRKPAQPAGGSSPAAEPKGPRQPVKLPALPAEPAALLVGAAVGLAAVVLTYLSLQACELVTGTGSCGGPGLIVLLVVVALMILGGSSALRMFDVPDSGGLSFLGVAMFVAVCLVVLLPNLLEPWMIIAAPVLCALTFGVAYWIVTRFDEDILERDELEHHDVR
jgi:hypothetical protein